MPALGRDVPQRGQLARRVAQGHAGVDDLGRALTVEVGDGRAAVLEGAGGLRCRGGGGPQRALVVEDQHLVLRVDADDLGDLVPVQVGHGELGAGAEAGGRVEDLLAGVAADRQQVAAQRAAVADEDDLGLLVPVQVDHRGGHDHRGGDPRTLDHGRLELLRGEAAALAFLVMSLGAGSVREADPLVAVGVPLAHLVAGAGALVLDADPLVAAAASRARDLGAGGVAEVVAPCTVPDRDAVTAAVGVGARGHRIGTSQQERSAGQQRRHQDTSLSCVHLRLQWGLYLRSKALPAGA